MKETGLERANHRLDLTTRLCLGAAGAATGMLNLGIAFFTLLYYSAALGVPAKIVSLAMAVALISDAVSDPLVGAWSDRTVTRWGRRHPFMYASILPAGLLYYAFWNPPEWALASDTTAFWFLLVLIAGVRLAATFFDVPSVTLIPELTRNYDRRTDLLSWHANFYYGSTSIALALIYGVALADTPNTKGILRVEGYQQAGLVGAIAISALMLVASVGLHRHIPFLTQPGSPIERRERFSLGRYFAPFKNISMLAVMISMVFFSILQGALSGLWGYLVSYFWGLSSGQITILAIMAILGPPLAFILMPYIFHGREKKHAAIGVLVAYVLIDAVPIFLRLLDLLPANGTRALAWIIYTQAVIQSAALTLNLIAASSMLTEIVEAHEVKTGAHAAGLISSARSFTRKLISAFGTALAGWVLTRIDFPTESDTFEVPAETLSNLGLHIGQIILVFGALAMAALFAYRITRADHQRNVEQLGRGHIEG